MNSDTRIDFRELSTLLATKHREKGGSAYCMDRTLTDAFYAVRCGCKLENLTPEDGVARFPGRLLSAKKLRKWLWDNRKDERLGDFTSVIWTLYDADGDVSVIGIARIHAPEKTPVGVTDAQPVQCQ